MPQYVHEAHSDKSVKRVFETNKSKTAIGLKNPRKTLETYKLNSPKSVSPDAQSHKRLNESLSDTLLPLTEMLRKLTKSKLPLQKLLEVKVGGVKVVEML
jgi:hypothetical protein